jgi:hypothetical protein
MGSDPTVRRVMEELEDDPLLKRMFKAAMGEADPEDTAVDVRSPGARRPHAQDRAAAGSLEPRQRPAVLLRLLDDGFAKERATQPTRH